MEHVAKALDVISTIAKPTHILHREWKQSNIYTLYTRHKIYSTMVWCGQVFTALLCYHFLLPFALFYVWNPSRWSLSTKKVYVLCVNKKGLGFLRCPSMFLFKDVTIIDIHCNIVMRYIFIYTWMFTPLSLFFSKEKRMCVSNLEKPKWKTESIWSVKMFLKS